MAEQAQDLFFDEDQQAEDAFLDEAFNAGNETFQFSSFFTGINKEIRGFALNKRERNTQAALSRILNFSFENPKSLSFPEASVIDESLLKIQKNSGSMGRNSSFGGQVMRAADRISGFKPWMYVKMNSRFVRFVIGTRDSTDTDFLLVGCFNPLMIGNAAYATTTNVTEDHSSGFNNMGTTQSLPIHRQWDEPAQMVKLKTIYQLYNCEHCEMFVKFTNTSPLQTIWVYWKLFWPKDHRVANNITTDDLSWPANSTSLLGLQADDAGVSTVNGEGRKSIAALESINGMRKITLGPNSSNGPSNVGVAYQKINVKDMMNQAGESWIFSATGRLTENNGAQEAAMSMTQTVAVNDSFQFPMVYFWAIQYDGSDASDTPGTIHAVQNDTAGSAAGLHPLWAEGTAEYTVRCFNLINENVDVGTQASDIS